MTLVDYLVLRPFDLNPRFQSHFPRMDFPEQALRVDLPASAAEDGTIEGTFDPDNSLVGKRSNNNVSQKYALPMGILIITGASTYLSTN